MSNETGRFQQCRQAVPVRRRHMLLFNGHRMIFICLWNGEGGDGPGGARHFMAEAGRKTAPLYWLDTRKLWS